MQAAGRGLLSITWILLIRIPTLAQGIQKIKGTHFHRVASPTHFHQLPSKPAAGQHILRAVQIAIQRPTFKNNAVMFEAP
jgi:hypothetical protein